MCSFFVSMLLTLNVFARAEDQAEALLPYATRPDSKLYASVEGFDNEGNLWAAYNWDNDLYLSKIDPEGEYVLDKLLLFEPGPEEPVLELSSPVITFDRWNNAYFAFSTKTRISPSDDIHFMRVSPEGEAKDYYPWPELSANGPTYIGVLPADTLMILGPSLSRTNRKPLWHLSKVSLHDNDFTPVVEETKDYRNYPTRLAFRLRYATSLTNWTQGWGTFAIIYEGTDKPDKGPDNLHLVELDLTLRSEDTHNAPREIYRWRDYIWKTYEAWIGLMFFAPYEEEGYVLYVPDPRDENLTHSIRLDDKGVPIDPSGLRKRGTATPRPFDRLPSDVRKYSRLNWWRDYFSNLDSARVVFWGSDRKGNLHTYSKSITNTED